jgi:3-hydroxyisobutyrate dehydrogenase-like beta-hydroxyacid dehydrogenase
LIGFVGTGVMGRRMARRLLDAGHPLIGYNRTRAHAQSLLEAGMGWAGTPRQVAEAADVVFASLANDAVLEAAVLGPDGILAGLRRDAVLVDMSTVSPSLSRRLAEAVRGRGAHMLDAPVSGSPRVIEEGRLAIMVGGEESVFERVRPLLEAIGPTVTYVGGSGQAALLKLAINVSVAGQVQFFAEGLVLALKGGIPLERALQVMLASAIASPVLKFRAPFMAEMPQTAPFSVAMMQKDLTLAQSEARNLGAALPATAVASEVLTAAAAAGMAEMDFAAVYRVLRRLAGLDI